MLQISRLATLLLSGCALSGIAAAAVPDPNLLNLVMPDAKVLAGVSITSIGISPFGRFLATKATPLLQSAEFTAIGFNPLQDVSEILVASAADQGHPGGIILATGNFPVDKIKAAIAGQRHPQAQTYGGATLLVNANSKGGGSGVAFIGNNIAVAGDLASVKAAVDRRTAASAIDSALAVKVNQVSAVEDEWVVSTVPVASLIPANATPPAEGPYAQVLPLLKSIQAFSGGVKYTDTVNLSAEADTSDPKNASALQAVIKLGIALISSSLNNPSKPHGQELANMLASLLSTTNDAAVNLTASVPESELETLVNSARPVMINPVPAPRRAPRQLRERRQGGADR